MADDQTTLRPVKIRRRPANARPILRIVAGRKCGESVAIEGSELTIGRDPEATLRLEDSGISRLHAKLLRASDGLVSVLDLGSTNGTFVNGTRVEFVVLREGDRVQLGPDVVIQLAYDEERGTTEGTELPLSPRQLEVARLVATGKTNVEVAAELGVSPRTITTHLDHIYARLGIRSRAALTRMLADAGKL